MTQRQHSLLGASLILSLALLFGRLAGFAREILLASFLGLSAQADIAIVLLTIPDLLVNLLLSGGIGVALIPALRQADPDQAAALYMQACLIIVSIFLCFATFFILAPYVWLWLLAPGIAGSSAWLESWMVYAVAAAIPLTALSGVSSAALNAMDRFFIAGCGTLIFNICVIAGLFIAILWQGNQIGWLCVGILFGALLRSLSQVLALRPIRSASSRQAAREWLIERDLVKAFLAGLASVSLLILVPVVLRACASVLGEGELAAFNYAIKLVELPLGILITSLATVAFPRLSGAYDRQDVALFSKVLHLSLERSLVLSLIVVLSGLPFIGAAVFCLFGVGRVGDSDLDHIASLTQIALLSVPLVGISSLAAAALNARRQADVVMRRTLLSIMFLPLLCLPGVLRAEPTLLMWSLPSFHLIHAFGLASALGFSHFKLSRVGVVRVIRTIASAAFLILSSVLIDTYVLKVNGGSWRYLEFLRLLFGGATFVGVVMLSLSILRSVK